MLTYKSEYSFIYRKNESHRLISKYPDRVPIICESLITNNQNEPLLDKTKYLAPIDLTIGQFQYVIRKRMSLNKERAIFLFINNNIHNTSQSLCFIYDNEKDEDGFLYIKYGFENTFG